MMKLRRKYKAEGVIMIKAHKCIRPLLCLKRMLLKIYEKVLEMQIKLSFRIATLDEKHNYQVMKSIVKLSIPKVIIKNLL